MEKKFNIVVGEDGTVKLPDAVLEKLEVKPGEEVRFEVDDNFYAVRLLSRIEAERLCRIKCVGIFRFLICVVSGTTRRPLE